MCIPVRCDVWCVEGPGGTRNNIILLGGARGATQKLMWGLGAIQNLSSSVGSRVQSVMGPVFVIRCLLCWSISRNGLRLMLACILPFHSCRSSSELACRERGGGDGVRVCVCVCGVCVCVWCVCVCVCVCVLTCIR